MAKREGRGVSTVLGMGVMAIVVLAAISVNYIITPGASNVSTITGGGASFPYPLITKWISEYNKINPQVQINYQSVGSGGGKNNLISKVFDFAGSDAPLSDAEVANYSILHIPETCGGVVVAYNIPDMEGSGLNLTADIIASIYQGTTTRWDDEAIAAINPGLELPSADIVTIHRSDSSGTTSVFTTYLADASQGWSLGKGTTVAWPVGLAGAQNSGVASILKQTPYSVGYLEFFYAKNNSIPYAHVQNGDGQFVEPTLHSITNAANAGVPYLSEDVRTPIVNLPGDDVYPISAFTYYLIRMDLSYMDYSKAIAIVSFMWWCVHDGQRFSEDLLYPALPSGVVSLDETILRSILYNGQKLIGG